ncbi:uncharacterized protein J4E78_004572 [Alternaria triticimaculans]|uniref:uncharacterized protein n=1 Tax=Alternaria triticimaculans TaxID=297637 RepID=UPI0020C1CF25|nr:uncharacterized protein J4E78_004572 [Alternaria triticimaculans]KAI4661782.1 hypothetical protein J4E78_004572 [Alternaria triticimaculans]
MATPEKKEEPPNVTPLLKLPRCSKTVAAPPSPDHYGSIVKVTVGKQDDRREFHVYSGLLAHYSSYFKAALKSCWRTPETVNLEDDNPEVFLAFFSWIYTGKLYSALDASGKVPLSMKLIFEIYVFGDARGAPELCNTAIDLLIQNMQQKWMFPNHELDYVYENTLQESALRRALLDFAVDNYRFVELVDPIQRLQELAKYPKEFLGDMLMALMALGKTPIPSSAGYGNLPYGKNNWATYIKPQVCSRYHNHPAPPA